MRRKLMLGMIFSSTSCMRRSMSPACMALSALMVCSTSCERRPIQASGVSPAARAAAGRPSASAAARAGAPSSRARRGRAESGMLFCMRVPFVSWCAARRAAGRGRIGMQIGGARWRRRLQSVCERSGRQPPGAARASWLQFRAAIRIADGRGRNACLPSAARDSESGWAAWPKTTRLSALSRLRTGCKQVLWQGIRRCGGLSKKEQIQAGKKQWLRKLF